MRWAAQTTLLLLAGPSLLADWLCGPPPTPPAAAANRAVMMGGARPQLVSEAKAIARRTEDTFQSQLLEKDKQLKIMQVRM